MLISVKGMPSSDLWAAADVTGYELRTRYWGDDGISVYSAGYVVAADLAWACYEDLVSQLRELKKHEGIRTGAWRS